MPRSTADPRGWNWGAGCRRSRRAAPRRLVRLRTRSHRRNEPTRHDRRHLTRSRRDLLGRDGGEPGSGHGISLLRPRHPGIDRMIGRLEGKKLHLQLVQDGLLVSPSKQPREGWKEAIEASLIAHCKEPLDSEWLDTSLASDDEWEW